MIRRKVYIAIALIQAITLSSVFGQDDYDMTFDVMATVQTTPLSVKLQWELTSKNTNISISRKLREDANFGTPVALSANATEYTDNTVVAGKIYEYYLEATSSREYISVAVNSPVIDYRGKLLLLVEKSLSTPLSEEINRLMMDIRGDGWQVIKIEVDAAAKSTAVKALIQNAYNLDKVNVKAVLLLGQIPLPLSGCIAPDGHGDHVGAWATDTYYADMDGNWTDNTSNCTGTFNANIPGDGKFDQGSMPTDAELQVGRVDMSNLGTYFRESYQELTRRYLYKDHSFRIKSISPPRKCIVRDEFHWGFAWSGYYFSKAVFGKGNTVKAATVDDFHSGNYLWSYASAGGNPLGFSSWQTSYFAEYTYNSVFTMLFGSYFGDYQYKDAFMKAALASKGWILTCSWAGRPLWEYHHMGTGDNIGYSAFVNMNANPYYQSSAYLRAVQINLLGDPTLRQDIIACPLNVRSSVVSSHVKLTWSHSKDVVDGYYIYKSKGIDSVFLRVTGTAITDTFWTDPAVADAKYYYQVKAYKVEKYRCGNYGNTSRGIFATNDPAVTDDPYAINKPYVVAHIPDQTGYVSSKFKYVIPLTTTFAHKDPVTLTYKVYNADGSALPAGWTYNESTASIYNAFPYQAQPIKIRVVAKATDPNLSFAADTFEINIIDTNQVPGSSLISSENELLVYPNPATDFVIITLPDQERLHVQLFDLIGIKIIDEYLNDSKVDLRDVKPGMYLLKVNGVTVKIRKDN